MVEDVNGAFVPVVGQVLVVVVALVEAVLRSTFSVSRQNRVEFAIGRWRGLGCGRWDKTQFDKELGDRMEFRLGRRRNGADVVLLRKIRLLDELCVIVALCAVRPRHQPVIKQPLESVDKQVVPEPGLGAHDVVLGSIVRQHCVDELHNVRPVLGKVGH